MAETSFDFDLAGPGAVLAGEAHDSAALLHARIDEFRRLLNMMENAVSVESGNCDKFHANAVLARMRVELVQIQLLLSSMPER
jgi:hypothetical protein